MVTGWAAGTVVGATAGTAVATAVGFGARAAGWVGAGAAGFASSAPHAEAGAFEANTPRSALRRVSRDPAVVSEFILSPFDPTSIRQWNSGWCLAPPIRRV